MKTSITSSLAALVAVTLLLPSCGKTPLDKTPLSEDSPEGMIVVSVSPESGAPTKAAASAVSGASAESAISTLQVFVFYAENNSGLGQSLGGKETDKYITFTGTDGSRSATLTTTTGKKRVYAIANAPRLQNVVSESDLRGRVLTLGDNLLEATGGRLGLTMAGAYGYLSGNAPVNVSSSDVTVLPYTQGSDASITTIPISLHRLSARIELQKIDVDFSGTWLEGLEFTLKEVYLKNIPNSVHATGQNADLLVAEGCWSNRLTPTASPVDGASKDIKPLVYESFGAGLSCNTAAGASTAVNSFFYCYPNPNTTDATAPTWSQRRTRLVIHGVISGTNAALGTDFSTPKDVYYPISIAAPENYIAAGEGETSTTPASSATHSQIVGNHKYVINKVTITSLGKSDDTNDDIFVSGKAKVEVSVQDWNGTTVLNFEM